MNLASEVLFGITAFDRPDHLTRLCESIRRYYPDVAVTVANNGKQPVRQSTLDLGVTEVSLPYDVGLSACRNALADRCCLPYMLLLEDDFVFCEGTCIEKFQDVLQANLSIGVVGGDAAGLNTNIREGVANVFDGLSLVGSSAPSSWTKEGVLYRPCEYVLNFALFRQAMLVDHRWDPDLKLAEHWDYFFSVKRAGKWGVAYVPEVVVLHDRGGRTAEYARMRGRAASYVKILDAKWNRANKAEINANLILLNDALARAGLFFWLIGGALLHFVRDGRMDNDTDVDFAFWQSDQPLMLQAIEELQSVGFEKFCRFCDETDHPTEYTLKKDGVKYEFFETRKLLPLFAWNAYDGATKYVRGTPAHGFTTVEHLGRQWRVTNNLDEYLVAVYGCDWRTPQPGWNWQNSTCTINKIEMSRCAKRTLP